MNSIICKRLELQKYPTPKCSDWIGRMVKMKQLAELDIPHEVKKAWKGIKWCKADGQTKDTVTDTGDFILINLLKYSKILIICVGSGKALAGK